MKTYTLHQIFNFVVNKESVDISFIEDIAELKMKERFDVSFDPFSNTEPSYIYYESTFDSHESFSKVEIKTPKSGICENSIIVFNLNLNSGLTWKYALSFIDGSSGELYSDAGGRLTSLKYHIDNKEIIFSKDNNSDFIKRVIITLPLTSSVKGWSDRKIITTTIFVAV